MGFMAMNAITKKHNKYPNLLKELGDAPKQLYYRGNWNPELFEKCLAVVGTRRMTSYGKRMTEQIAGEVAAAGITIVSKAYLVVSSTAWVTPAYFT